MDDIVTLEHYGIKGMRWGVRRKRGSSGRVSSDYSSVKKLQKKKLSQLSNDDLQKIKKRMDLERDVKSASPNPGKKLVNATLGKYGNQVVGGLISAAAGATVAAIIAKVKRG